MLSDTEAHIQKIVLGTYRVPGFDLIIEDHQ